jgi:hypothetical protein
MTNDSILYVRGSRLRGEIVASQKIGGRAAYGDIIRSLLSQGDELPISPELFAPNDCDAAPDAPTLRRTASRLPLVRMGKTLGQPHRSFGRRLPALTASRCPPLGRSPRFGPNARRRLYRQSRCRRDNVRSAEWIIALVDGERPREDSDQARTGMGMPTGITVRIKDIVGDIDVRRRICLQPDFPLVRPKMDADSVKATWSGKDRRSDADRVGCPGRHGC